MYRPKSALLDLAVVLIALPLSAYLLAAQPRAALGPAPSGAATPQANMIAPDGPHTPAPASSSSGPRAAAAANGRIAFASNRDGNHEIYVMDADGSNQTRITYHPAYDDQPRWSPDGTRLVFMSNRDGNFELYLMAADGTNQMRLTNSPAAEGFPTWSPDGARIAFVSGDLTDLVTYEIYVVNADGSNLKRLTNNSVTDCTPAWSPDGARIAFMSGNGIFAPDSYEIYVMDADGNNRTRLTNDAQGDALPAWSPDGTRLAFVSGDLFFNPSGGELYAMDADGSNRTRLTNNNNATEGFPAWSPDGSKIVYASGSIMNENGVELYTINTNGSNPVQLTTNTALEWFPDWQRVSAPPPVNTVQFSAATFQASESDERATVTVTRSGDTTGAATVNYATVDDPAAIRCDQLSVVSPGAAYARCDYATTVDTLQFAAGETEKTFTIPLINDAHVEPPETVQLRLSVAAGATLGAQTTATLIIASDDTNANVPNPIFTTPFFVRQQYLDFLSREPEAGEPWSNVLNNCPDVNNDPTCDRILVSSSFFGSPEFQLKGFYVFLFYKVSLSRRPDYAEIIPDMRAVTGQTAAEVFQKRTSFAHVWTLRPEFRSRYDQLSNETYVAALLGPYQLTQITTPDPANPDGTVLVTLTQTDLVNRLNTQALTRAQVLRAIVQSREVNAREFNQAFVAMQYYGYLRRTPEPGGYQAWLNYLTAHPSDFRTMINGFMNSAEYRLRFGVAQ